MSTKGYLVAPIVAGLAATQAGAASDPALRADLEALSRRSVFFGHQSVGTNIVDGLRDLAAQEGVPLRIVESPDVRAVAPGTFAHGLVPENGNPALKIESFGRALDVPGPGPDVAFLKFCFVDVVDSTDARALFARYRDAMRALAARHPRTTFVHVTVPLTAIQTGWKATVKTLLGRTPYGVLENARREEFNELMRDAYAGREPLFDLARVESTGPDGRRRTDETKGRRVPALVPGYTNDGGHLDVTGRRRVARELVAFLAALEPRSGPAAGAERK